MDATRSNGPRSLRKRSTQSAVTVLDGMEKIERIELYRQRPSKAIPRKSDGVKKEEKLEKNMSARILIPEISLWDHDEDVLAVLAPATVTASNRSSRRVLLRSASSGVIKQDMMEPPIKKSRKAPARKSLIMKVILLALITKITIFRKMQNLKIGLNTQILHFMPRHFLNMILQITSLRISLKPHFFVGIGH